MSIAPTENESIFGEGESVDSAPQRVLPLVAGLIVLGVAIAAIGIVIATFVIGGAATSGPGAASTFDIERVEYFAQVDLPEGTTVLASVYSDEPGELTTTSTVQLPVGAENPLEGTAYAESDPVPDDFLERASELTDPRFYLAIGDAGIYTALVGTDAATGRLTIDFTSTQPQQ